MKTIDINELKQNAVHTGLLETMIFLNKVNHAGRNSKRRAEKRKITTTPAKGSPQFSFFEL